MTETPMVERTLDPWIETDLDALLQLETIGPLHYRNRYGDPNPNGRSYGGQLLANGLMAASMSVPDDRPAAAMQFLFLQGALHDLPIDLHVTVLQDGKRFSSRHVRGVQPGGRSVFDAHVTYAVAMDSPVHSTPSTAVDDPESLQRLCDVPPEWGEGLRPLGAYSMDVKSCLDFRLPDAERILSGPDESRVRFWLRALAVSSHPRLQEAAFAYMSDWWVNFSSLGSHARELSQSDQRIYISSLNHAIWFHRPFRADGWLHFETDSAMACNGRGLSIARVHDRHGQFVSTVSQECLMAYA